MDLLGRLHNDLISGARQRIRMSAANGLICLLYFNLEVIK